MDVNDVVQERIEAARRKIAADKRRREELAAARRYGLEARKRQKLRNLRGAADHAVVGRQPTTVGQSPKDAAPNRRDTPTFATDGLSVTNGTSLHSVETLDSLTTDEGSVRTTDGIPDVLSNRTLAASGV